MEISFSHFNLIFTPVCIIVLGCSSNLQAQNIMLDGTVTGASFGNHPPTTVTAELKQTGDPLGSTETEENG